MHQAYETATTDAEVVRMFQAALDEMRRAGAEIVDPVAVDSLDEIRKLQTGTCSAFKVELNSSDGGKSTVWVSKTSRKPVKSVTISPAMNGAVITSELQKD